MGINAEYMGNLEVRIGTGWEQCPAK